MSLDGNQSCSLCSQVLHVLILLPAKRLSSHYTTPMDMLLKTSLNTMIIATKPCTTVPLLDPVLVGVISTYQTTLRTTTTRALIADTLTPPLRDIVAIAAVRFMPVAIDFLPRISKYFMKH